MKVFLATAATLGFLIPVTAYGQFSCPETLDAELDWDGDGILNKDDPCCFVTSRKGDETAKMCGEKRSADMNGNGIAADEEGMCCVSLSTTIDSVASPARSYCYPAISREAEGTDTETASDDTAELASTDGETTDDTSEGGEDADTSDDAHHDDTQRAGDGSSEDTSDAETEGDTSTGESRGGDSAMSGTDSGWAFGDDSEYACATDIEVLVPCDQLLMYDGMPLDGGLSDVTADCGEDGCICYTIGDYDNDDSFSNGGIDGPFDNCPVTWNAGADYENGMQSDVDDDYFGDACDVCQGPVDAFFNELAALTDEEFERKFVALQCEIGGSDCPGGACVPRAFENPFYDGNADSAVYTDAAILVGNFCSSPSDIDDDGVGDSCDNCIAVKNSEQRDQDSDMAGDLCDACPSDAAIWEQNDGMLNGDSDHVIDACDNCPAVDNPAQLDDDSDGVGNKCDLCPQDATIFGGVSDMDSDGYADVCDNCKTVANPEQLDTDSNGIGDVCENDTETSSGDTSTDTATATDTARPHDTHTSQSNTDTGAVSFSGGGVISCQVVVTGHSRRVDEVSLLSLLSLF